MAITRSRNMSTSRTFKTWEEKRREGGRKESADAGTNFARFQGCCSDGKEVNDGIQKSASMAPRRSGA
jgi:hypothetical protein